MVMNEEANYRNYTINHDECVIIRLDSNFATNIQSTNHLRENEYANYIIRQIRDIVPNRDIEISEDTGITINIGLHSNKLAISIRFYDLNEYYNFVPNFAKEMTENLYAKIDNTIVQFINDINSAKIPFVTFDDDQKIQIFNNKIYGYFYDLNTNKYIQPPKATLNYVHIKEIITPVKERIESFIRQ